jgi:feruloyl esterase
MLFRSFKRLLLNGAAATLGLAGLSTAAGADAAPGNTPALSAASCAALTGFDFSAEIGVPVQILSAELLGGACRVEGYVNPQISIRLILPASGWNGKMLEIGNGGMAGSFPITMEAAGSGDPIAGGYAVIMTDGGHKSSMLDARWADHNLSALIDYSFRAVHMGSLLGKALVAHAYGRPAQLAYFAGCSDGGREAIMLAQRFPTDFNGIIAGAPSMRMANIYLNLYWMGRHVGARRPGGPMSVATLRLLHTAALKQCSEISGLSHGNLLHPERCTMDLRPLACAPGASGPACLTSTELADASAVYEGPRRSDGSAVGPPSAMPGSELQWVMMANAAFADYPFDVYRHIAFGAPPAPGWKGNEPDLDLYPASMATVEALWSPTNPDLRAFSDNGGKILSYMGLNDPVGGVMDTIDYYRTVRHLMGGPDRTSSFYRLFTIPGMAHCTGGPGAFRIDYLQALDGWVDRGEAPTSLHGEHPEDPGSGAFQEWIKPFE